MKIVEYYTKKLDCTEMCNQLRELGINYQLSMEPTGSIFKATFALELSERELYLMGLSYDQGYSEGYNAL